jgi:hypothetical protein
MRVEEPPEQAKLQDDVFQLFMKTFLFSFRVQFLNTFHLCDYYFINSQLPIVFSLEPLEFTVTSKNSSGLASKK